jgi:hypothetical protein
MVDNHKILKSLLSLLILIVVIISSVISKRVIASRGLHVDLVQNHYLPVIMNTYPRNTPFGVTMFTIDTQGGLMQFSDDGTSWTRAGIYWSMIEPVEGQRNWDAGLEQQLVNAATYHIKPVVFIESTPDWALQPGFNCGVVSKNKFPMLAQFAYDLVKRYSAPPYYIHYWELWNEPDVDGFLGCWGNPEDQYYGGYYYGQMLQAVYPRIKEADPSAQVLVGGLLLDCDPNNPPSGKDCLSSKFLKGILASGAGPFFDGVSFHAYDYYTGTGTYDNPNWQSSSQTSGPVLIAKAKYIRGLLGEYGFSEKYLMNTEMAVFYGPNQTYPLCDPTAPPDVEVTKVYYMIHSYAAAVAEGLKANIWYAALGGRCAALLNADLSPKPAYYAYQFAQNKLSEAQFIRQINEYGTEVMGYEYDIPGRKLWVIWSKDAQPHQISLSTAPILVNRVGDDGVPVVEDNSGTLTIDKNPRFIEFNK